MRLLVERIANAAAALVAGASIAVEHLRRQPEPVAVVETLCAHCPECGGGLEAGPHFHADRAYWSCEDRLGVLVTDGHGAVV